MAHGRPLGHAQHLTEPWRPTKAELAAAVDKTVPDIIAPGLKVLFCGINPGLYSGAVERHFARPGNRFWKALHLAGFTPRLASCFDDPAELLALGLGITNIVERSTAAASELSTAELQDGARRLEEKVLACRPDFLAVVGISAYCTAFGRLKANLGRQPETIGSTRVWVLPNPSGLQAHYQLPELARMFGDLRQAAFG